MQLNFSGFKHHGLAIVVFLSASFFTAPSANADAGFQKWIRDFYSVASNQGISRQTYNAVFAGITSPDPEVIKSANFQPEFKSKVWDYMDNRITQSAIEKGLEMKAKYKRWLDIIEKRFL